MTNIPWLDTSLSFPPLESALGDPNGLLAAGGDLSEARLLQAYSLGIFPWYEAGQPILWWSPDPRLVLFPEEFHLSRSLKKTLRRGGFDISSNRSFSDVIELCAAPRSYSSDTWITGDMKGAYCNLHQQGFAHSIEVWHKKQLVGGLYGVLLGQVFFGESMFSLMPDASKVALQFLCTKMQEKNFKLIDCQVSSKHLLSLGAREISRKEFSTMLLRYIDMDSSQGIPGDTERGSFITQTSL